MLFVLLSTLILIQVPLVEHGVFELEVKVEGATFHSRDVKKVMAKVYKPRIFIQTDKPIYLPGQTGKAQLMFCRVAESPDNIPQLFSILKNSSDSCFKCSPLS